MKKTILIASLLSLSFSGPAFAAKTPSSRDKARDLVLKKDYAAAVVSYNAIARGSTDGRLAAEYAYVLALAGYGDLALSHLDRAFLSDATEDEVLYYASSIFAALGLSDAAAEIARPAPAWLGQGIPIGKLTHRELGTYREELDSANLLIAQRRFASAADRFARITKKHPQESLGWSGYSIALEKIGAFKAAAQSVGMDLDLSKSEDESTRQLLAEHKAELAARPKVQPEPPLKANDLLKGRFLSFFGMTYNHTETDSIFNLNTRVGKFLTNRIDVAANFGITSGYEDSDYNGVNLGVSGRYNKPLPVAMPLNATAGARIEYLPGPSDNFALVLSPGLSYFMKNGSLDLYLDIALSGPVKDTKTLSLGYTVYFGGPKK